MRTVKMYEDGKAYENDEFIGRCDVPNFDHKYEMDEHGFSISDIEEDEKGRYIEVEAEKFGF